MRYRPVLHPGIEGDPSEVAAGSAEAGDQPRLQRIYHERNNRYCTGCRLEDDHDGVGSGDNHIRLAGDDLPGQVGIALVMSLGGIPFDNQILSFNVTQAAKLPEKRTPCAPPTRFGKECSRDCRMENRYPLLRCRLLRACRERPRDYSAANKRNELAPPHSITSSARASTWGGSSRPSVFAVLRFITS